jgi:hypothetical protein
MELWEHFGFAFLQMSRYIVLCVFSFTLTLFFILFYWTSCFVKSCVGIVSLISYRMHWTYDDWTLSFMKDSCDFLVYICFIWFIICDLVLLIFGNMLMNLNGFA